MAVQRRERRERDRDRDRLRERERERGSENDRDRERYRDRESVQRRPPQHRRERESTCCITGTWPHSLALETLCDLSCSRCECDSTALSRPTFTALTWPWRPVLVMIYLCSR